MGWQGNAQNVAIDKVRAHRYGDLQDSKGQNVGGIGKWFAPPHLVYFRYDPAADAVLFNRNITIHDVIDAGPRVGTARDQGGSDTISGFAGSLKIGCVDCSVDDYTSNRPDGFLDVLTSDGLTISNVTATFNSAFVHDLYSAWRFPQPPYKNVTFENISLTDTAPATNRAPISSIADGFSENITFANVRVVINRWTGSGMPLPVFSGDGDSIGLDFSLLHEASRIMSLDKAGVRVTLQATPATSKLGERSTLTWFSRNTSSCSGANAWNGAMAGQGSKTVAPATAGTYEFTLTCRNSSSSSSVILPLLVNQ